MSNPIKTTDELIAAMMVDPSGRLFWSAGNRPAAPGAYSFRGVRVYAKAVAGAENKKLLRLIRSDFMSRAYRLASPLLAQTQNPEN